ncbi:glutamine--fructose-6-phosphate transaminase (isomerizing) [Virgibacillus sp. 179-BFC.A HS]|uniref:Glutamine--fructose-6-phosphate aminotransferase [isomerizing] n=1 Tax=Tigheibacillus jepli TaxID=3035914 RepID=A0ABU5CMK5_9BACI|nr:glutamine--fructose-6-phosphate transaminase (isomerizing) [Virgibacillus sp. 179-BFC.A HS]MDY0407126.1 glutamine--fructose-6-phosphate transaminase (isomerizing) [Virgibacillus sp. 179-BFC.A HS]
MCGIVGYIGQQDTKEILLNGLNKLEYRGYDSAGIAMLNEEGISLFKATGRIANLRKRVDNSISATMGIGHTRWATHGIPSGENAHPHMSASGRFVLVHNGVIENYVELKRELLADVSFVSETDTEVIVQLVEKFANEGMDTKTAFQRALQQLEGSYAIAMIDREDSENLYVAKNKSPLLLGVGAGFHVVASDAMATLQLTDMYIEIHDKEMVLLSKDHAVIEKLDGTPVNRDTFQVTIDASEMEKGTYDHFMLKEIDEQPLVMRKIIEAYENEQNQLVLPPEILSATTGCDRIYIIACGTSYHAGLVGKQLLEKLAQVSVEVHVASEFSYNMPLLSGKPLFIFISQSGETADSRSVLVKVKEMGFPALTLTNVPGSTLSREADYTLNLHAGPEIAVASTKAYTAQIAVLAILAATTAKAKGIQTDFDLVQELAIVANAMEVLTQQKETIEELAHAYLDTTRNAFFIGRSADYFVCLEGALKLKEISYIQAEGFAGGELKHGTIALIEEGTPVIALDTQAGVHGAIRGNVQEVVARGANALVVSMQGLELDEDAFVLPHVHELLTPLISVVPLQLLAYYAALHSDCDVDKPRNLAKSVTVE